MWHSFLLLYWYSLIQCTLIWLTVLLFLPDYSCLTSIIDYWALMMESILIGILMMMDWWYSILNYWCRYWYSSLLILLIHSDDIHDIDDGILLRNIYSIHCRYSIYSFLSDIFPILTLMTCGDIHWWWWPILDDDVRDLIFILCHSRCTAASNESQY